jgi:hypothetical protein
VLIAQSSDTRFNPPRGAGRVAPKDILPHSGFEEGNSRPPRGIALLDLPSVKLGERGIHGARATVEVLALGLLCDLRENFVDEVTGVRPTRTLGDHIKGSLHGTFQLGDRLTEVEHLAL